jgi:hypothetical protein
MVVYLMLRPANIAAWLSGEMVPAVREIFGGKYFF